MDAEQVPQAKLARKVDAEPVPTAKVTRKGSICLSTDEHNSTHGNIWLCEYERCSKGNETEASTSKQEMHITHTYKRWHLEC